MVQPPCHPVAVNYRKADLSPRERACFTRDEAWDIGAIAAFFAMSNRLANMASMRPNDGFYLTGRVPKPAR